MAEEKQNKRSKRHRMKRNNISDKDRVEAVKQFSEYAREVEKNTEQNILKNK